MHAPSRYLVTAALPYGNGPIHIGHLAGVYLPADIYARFLRLKGEDILFVCGQDEHGVAITMKARQEGKSPREIIDYYYEQSRRSFEQFGISFDIYHRTSDPLHHQTAQEFFLTLYRKGILEEHETEQFYDPEAQQFLADRYIEGTCPHCGYEGAYGDQCEQCGTSLSPDELINPRSRLSRATPIKKKTKHFYLPLHRYEEWLRRWILEEHADDWKPNVVGQCKSWLDAGLRPRAITRDLDWGVPVPLPGYEGKVLYVWFDAPIGYISATRAWALRRAEADPHAHHPDDWKDYWQRDDTYLVHFLGKDNIVFHAIIFPVMLKAHGGYVLPANVPANEYMNLEGGKVSTSRRRAVWLHEYLEDFPGKQDVLRYVLTALMPETRDSEFSWKAFQSRNNEELVSILGNFVHRVLVLIHRFFEGRIPTPRLTEADRRVLDAGRQAFADIEVALRRFRFREALHHMMGIAREGNKYLTEQEPWKLMKTDPERAGTILYTAAQLTAYLAVTAEPFLPFSARKLQQWLHLPPLRWDPDAVALTPGRPIEKGHHLFEKIDDETVDRQRQKLARTASPSPSLPPLKPTISYDDFAKLDLRVGRIRSAEKVKKTRKLVRLEVDLGMEVRQIVAGIAEHYDPAELVGRQAVVVANLAPKKLRGLTSEGMLLMAEDPATGRLVFIGPDDEIPPGARVQ